MKRTHPKHGTVLDCKPGHHLYKVDLHGNAKWIRADDLASVTRAADIVQTKQQQQTPQQQEGNACAWSSGPDISSLMEWALKELRQKSSSGELTKAFYQECVTADFKNLERSHSLVN